MKLRAIYESVAGPGHGGKYWVAPDGSYEWLGMSEHGESFDYFATQYPKYQATFDLANRLIAVDMKMREDAPELEDEYLALQKQLWHTMLGTGFVRIAGLDDYYGLAAQVGQSAVSTGLSALRKFLRSGESPDKGQVIIDISPFGTDVPVHTLEWDSTDDFLSGERPTIRRKQHHHS